MAATTVTTIILIVFAVFVISWGLYNLFGNWDLAVERPRPEERVEAEFQRAVREMRQAIEEYERGERSPYDSGPPGR